MYLSACVLLYNYIIPHCTSTNIVSPSTVTKFSLRIRPPTKHTTAANSLNITLTIFNTSMTYSNKSKFNSPLHTAVASVSVKTQRAPRKHLWASLAGSESAQILYHTNIHAFINSHFPCTCKRPGLPYVHFWQPLF